jgi:histidinol-phosphate phosphatase family protein
MTKKAVFLDRDGTINEEVNYLSKKEQVEILPKVPEAIKLLNENDFLVIIISNQSGVARGYFTTDTLNEINDHLIGELSEKGAEIDGLFICPHHPDSDCDCRKPRTGLLKNAALKFNIDLLSSYIIGDKYTDLKTGFNAGCKTILVLTGYGKEENEKKGSWDFEPDIVAEDLFQAAKWIIEEEAK